LGPGLYLQAPPGYLQVPLGHRIAAVLAFRRLNHGFTGHIAAGESSKSVKEKQMPEISLLFLIPEDTEASFTEK